MRAADLGRLLKCARRSGAGWVAKCPAHEDKSPSLSWQDGEDRVLVKCFAGCSFGEIARALNLTESDFWHNPIMPPHSNGRGGGASTPPESPATVQHPPKKPENADEKQGCTLSAYAEAKRLPAATLHKWGLSDVHYQGAPAVRIVYFNPDGTEAAVRFRLSLEGDNRFRWKSGSRARLYGLERLTQARETGLIVPVEGESDCHTLWFHGIPAIGIPGAATWKNEWGEHLEGIGQIYLVREHDKASDALLEKFKDSGFADRVSVVSLAPYKDPSALYIADPEAFPSRWAEALDKAIPLAEIVQAEAEEKINTAWDRCRGLAHEPDILARFEKDLALRGVAGEARVGKILYVCMVSRFLKRPVSAVVKGPSSGGKSFLVENVLEFFPPRAFYALSGMSEKALAYSNEPLKHRFMVIYEADGLASDFAQYLMRSLLSEGRVRYETIEKIDGALEPRLIEREGPTGLLLTTTRITLHPENETRLLSIPVTDTPEQTKAVLRRLAIEEADSPQVDLETWRAFQEWLAGAEHRVHIPFAGGLAEAIPPAAVRLRRDFQALLSLIRAHAILHQATREKREDGAIIATLADYSAARELVADIIGQGVEASVPPSVRETVGAVAQILAPGREVATVAQVAATLGLDKSAASRRVRAAHQRGFLENLETKKGRPARLILADPLPEEREIFPLAEALAGDRCSVAVQPGGIDPPSPPLEDYEL